MGGFKDWLISQPATFNIVGMVKLLSRYDKCFKSGGDYVEK
jgi:hypothetical protein